MPWGSRCNDVLKAKLDINSKITKPERVFIQIWNVCVFAIALKILMEDPPIMQVVKSGGGFENLIILW